MLDVYRVGGLILALLVILWLIIGLIEPRKTIYWHRYPSRIFVVLYGMGAAVVLSAFFFNLPAAAEKIVSLREKMRLDLLAQVQMDSVLMAELGVDSLETFSGQVVERPEESVVREYISSGKIIRIETLAHRVYVAPLAWDTLSTDNKEKLIRTFGKYFDHKNHESHSTCEVIDYKSGKRLANLSKEKGISLE